MRKNRIISKLILVGIGFGASVSNVAAQQLSAPHVNEFIPNQGQIIDINGQQRPEILYKTVTGESTMFLTKNGWSYVQAKVHSHNLTDSIGIDSLSRVDLQFLGTNPAMKLVPADPAQGVLNFYTNGSSITGVTAYQKITYQNLYNNIDLIITNLGAAPLYQFVLRSGANPNDIQFTFGSETAVSLTSEGIMVNSLLGTISLPTPQATNQGGGLGTSVPAVFVRNGTIFGISTQGASLQSIITINISLAQLNAIIQLPKTVGQKWSTPYGGTGVDGIIDMVESHTLGNHYYVGVSLSTNFPTSTGAFRPTGASATNEDAFVLAFDGYDRRVFATLYGGGRKEIAGAITTFGNNVYITGYTETFADLPKVQVVGGFYQSALNAGSDASGAFLARLNGNTGKLTWSTYFGHTPQSGSMTTTSLCVDQQGNLYVAGGIDNGSSFPIVNNGVAGAYNRAAYTGGSNDGFIAKFNGNTLAQQWGTYIGSMGDEQIQSIACDVNSNAIYVVGKNISENFSQWHLVGDPTAYKQQNFGNTDAFFIRFDANGIPTWSTCFGGSDDEYPINYLNRPHEIAFDNAGNVWFVGSTYSSDFPVLSVPGAYNTPHISSQDAYIAEFNANGKQLWATCYGGTDLDVAQGVAFDPSTNAIYVTGNTNSKDFSSFQATAADYNQSNLSGGVAGGSEDAFLIAFDVNSRARTWATYFGGTKRDFGSSITAFNGIIRISGETNSSDYPTQNELGAYSQNFSASGSNGIGAIAAFRKLCGLCLTNTHFLLRKGNLQEAEAGTFNVSLYPNPAVNVLNVSIENIDQKDFTIAMYNTLGQKVYSIQRSLDKDISNVDHQINTANYPDGIYFVKVNTGSSSFEQKIVISK